MQQSIFNSIEESHSVNLCDLYFSVNRNLKIFNTHLHNYSTGVEQVTDEIEIANPTVFDFILTKTQYQKYSSMLIEAGKAFSSRFIPKGYCKNQYDDLYEITINLGYERDRPFVKLIEFGGSYGKILIDDKFTASVSHSGSTSGKGWRDSATSWHIVGNGSFSSKDKMDTINYLINFYIKGK